MKEEKDVPVEQVVSGWDRLMQDLAIEREPGEKLEDMKYLVRGHLRKIGPKTE